VWCVQPCMTGCPPVHPGGGEGYRLQAGNRVCQTCMQRCAGRGWSGLVLQWQDLSLQRQGRSCPECWSVSSGVCAGQATCPGHTTCSASSAEADRACSTGYQLVASSWWPWQCSLPPTQQCSRLCVMATAAMHCNSQGFCKVIKSHRFAGRSCQSWRFAQRPSAPHPPVSPACHNPTTANTVCL
jgi:hypothetical protein